MTPEETVDRFIELICAKDIDGACELVDAACEYDNVPMGKQFGPEGIKALLGPMVDGLDEVEFVIHRQVAAGRLVLNERSDRFRIGEKWIDLPVAGVFEVGDDGLIVLWRDYFDATTFNEQLTALLS
jgi:limonene-1,2-epoxide hydrolase